MPLHTIQSQLETYLIILNFNPSFSPNYALWHIAEFSQTVFIVSL